MDDRPVDSIVRKIEENARKVLSLSPRDNNEGNRALSKISAPIKIKEEISEEIQEYAATTMSELLGWYGYDKVDSGCTRSLNLDHFASRSNPENNKIRQSMNESIASSKLTSSRPTSVATSDSHFEASSIPLSYSTNTLISMDRQLVLPTLKKAAHKHHNNTGPDQMSCTWCGRTTHVCESEKYNSLSYNMTNALEHFCSEACFVAGRRAIFKQTKTCHWCRHIRNPTNSFDFQDDESQLQFCSDKCLNQYKMHIFCHETQTHLMLQGLNNASFHDTKDGLITPELWFRNCQSPLNNSTEDSCSTENGENYLKQSVECSPKISRKKDSIYANKCAKRSNCSDRKKNCYADSNEIDMKESAEKHASTTDEDMLYHFQSKETSRVHCLENNLNCKNLKKECPMMENMNHDSHTDKNSKNLLERDIHVRHMRNLQEEKHHKTSDDVLHASPWIATSATSLRHPGIPFLSKTCTKEPNQRKHQGSPDISSGISTAMKTNQSESIHPSSATILPPVTVLVPYPIPLPIPIPIPIPIPLSLAILDKLKNDDKRDTMNAKSLDCKKPAQQDSAENACSVPDSSQIDTISAKRIDERQYVKSDKCNVSTSTNNTSKEQKVKNSQQFKQNTKPLRKRKRSADTVSLISKRFS